MPLHPYAEPSVRRVTGRLCNRVTGGEVGPERAVLMAQASWGSGGHDPEAAYEKAGGRHICTTHRLFKSSFWWPLLHWRLFGCFVRLRTLFSHDIGH
jgi:hypothetical protein